METTTINRSVTILFEWMGCSYKRTLLRKNFREQLDRFYAYFHIGNSHFYFEDDLDGGQPVLRMPGVWYEPIDENEEAKYFWEPEYLQVSAIDGCPVCIINNGRK